MNGVHLALSLVVALGCGWFGALCADRVPGRLPLRGARVQWGLRSIAIVVASSALAVLCAWRLGTSSVAEMLVYVVWFAWMVALSAIDLEHMRLPDALVLPGFIVGVAIVSVISVVDGNPARIRYALVGSAASFAVLLAAHLVSPRGMGFGDVKFSAVLGLAVGWRADSVAQSLSLVLWSLLLGFGAGSVLGIALLIARRRNQPFPFGPFLALGAGITVLVSASILS